MTNIAIIGAGNVGTTIGLALRAKGHAVTWGVPDPTKEKYIALGATTPETAAKNADVIFLAIPWTVAEAGIRELGNVEGKILIDATNPVAPDFSGLLDLGGKSAGEHIAGWATGARVVKAFNTIGYNIMENPKFGDYGATLLMASDDFDAKAVTAELATAMGFAPVDTGALRMARQLESAAWLWITLAMKQGYGRDIALQLIKR